MVPTVEGELKVKLVSNRSLYNLRTVDSSVSVKIFFPEGVTFGHLDSSFLCLRKLGDQNEKGCNVTGSKIPNNIIGDRSIIADLLALQNCKLVQPLGPAVSVLPGND